MATVPYKSPVLKQATQPTNGLGGPQMTPQQPTLNADPYVASPTAPQSTSTAAANPAVASSTINPAADLRSQQFLPQGGAGAYAAQGDNYGLQAASALGTGQVAQSDYGKLQGLIDRLASGAGGGGGSFGGSGDTNALRQKYLDSINGLEGPNREELAAKQFALLQEQGEPAFQEQLRQVGQRAAAFGRTGAGMTTNDLGTVAQRRNEALSQAARGLSYDAAGQSLADKLAISGATGEGYDRIGRVDLNADIARSNSGLAGLGVLERALGAQFDLEGLKRREGESDRSYGLDRAGAFSGLSGQAFGQGQGLRNEYRGERDYQTDASQRGIDNAVKQRFMEDDLLGSEFDRNQREQSQLFNQGYSGYLPAQNALEGAADRDQASADSTFGDIGSMLEEYMRGQATKKPGRGKTEADFPAIPKGGF